MVLVEWPFDDEAMFRRDRSGAMLKAGRLLQIRESHGWRHPPAKPGERASPRRTLLGMGQKRRTSVHMRRLLGAANNHGTDYGAIAWTLSFFLWRDGLRVHNDNEHSVA